VSQSREREQDSTQAPAAAERSAPANVAPPVARILAMQRGSGNAATARWLSREPGTATAPASGISGGYRDKLASPLDTARWSAC
jgi:hypothetical protein